MNTTTATKSFALFAVAAVAFVAAAILQSPAKPAASEIVQLERVVIVGKRAEAAVVAQLPRVVITGRSTAAGYTQLAAAGTTPAI